MITICRRCKSAHLLLTGAAGHLGTGLLARRQRAELRAVDQAFLPERDYITFGSLLSQIRLSFLCLSSVTFVRPTQGVETFGNISLPFCTF